MSVEMVPVVVENINKKQNLRTVVKMMDTVESFI